MSDVLERLRAANPVPRDLSTDWSHSAEGAATRTAVEGKIPAERHRRRPWAAAVAAVLVLGLVVALALVQRGSEEATTPASSSVVDRLAGGRWSTVGAGPAKGITDASTVWTGTELIVWGRRAGENSPAGAAYNPRRKVWRAIEPPPLLGPARSDVISLWTGDEMFIWGGRYAGTLDPGPFLMPVREYADGAAYNPRTGAWRHVGGAPFEGTASTSTATVVDGQVVVTRGAAAVAYSLRERRWEDLPDMPVSFAEGSVRAASTGREVVYTGSTLESPSGAALVYEPTTRTWRVLSPPPLTGQSGVVDLVRDGRSVASLDWFAGGNAHNSLRSQRLEMDANRWVEGRSTFPHRGICAVDANPVPRGAVVVCDTQHLMGLDLTSDKWRRLPRPPGRLPRSVDWDGRELLAFTGARLLVLGPSAP